ncbi:MAG: ChaN family lipoprotein [Planctomycetota bacterium]
MLTRFKSLRVASLLAIAPFFAGCDSAPEPVEQGEASPPAPTYPAWEMSALEQTPCFDGRTFKPLSASELVRRASAADVVLIGEMHGDEAGLAASAALWRAILDERPSAVLALEFVERDEQIALDDWLAEDELSTPDALSADHAPLLMAAKQRGRPVVAANAPRRYVRLARTAGYDHLRAMTPAQRATFVFPDPMPAGPYRDRFFELFGGGVHGGGMPTEQIEAYWRAQAMWDATMADSVLRALDDGDGPVVLVVGRFHVDRDGGVLQMLRAGRPDVSVFSVVMAGVDEIEEAESDVAADSEGSPPIADALWAVSD